MLPPNRALAWPERRFAARPGARPCRGCPPRSGRTPCRDGGAGGPAASAADLDEAAQADPNSAQIWTTRGLAYERLGDKATAAGSYGHAISIRPKDEAARSGFARVGGRPGQSYDAF